ncbi:MAG: ABC transporter permease [Pseudomonadota bacterium]
MRRAIFKAMVLTLWRDRAAFALAFLLPPVIFAIFAAVFAPAAGGDLSIRLAVVAADDDVSRALVDGLRQSGLISAVDEMGTVEALSKNLREGRTDAGIVIDRPDETSPPRFRIYADPMKENAATIAEATLAAQAPPDMIGDVQPAERVMVDNADGETPIAAYFAAGVSMLFIFLAGFQSSLTVLEERDAGVLERIAAGAFGVRPMIDAKFSFLVVQAMSQIILIFAIAFLLFDVPPPRSVPAFAVTVFAAAFCAAGLCLAITGLARTRAQAHAIGAVLALLLGALGGSMAPRFLMSPEVRALGALTPHAWGIDAFSAVLWRGGGLDLLWGPWLLLFAAGAAGLAISYAIMPVALRAG